MANQPFSPIQQKIAQVRRYQFIQSFLNHLLACLAAALVLAAVWFLVHPYVLGISESWVRWSILGGATVGAFLLALLLTWLRAPKHVESALALDERFGLKERVTTSLTLSPEQVDSPAGLALIQDVEEQLTSVRVGNKFTVRLSWKRALAPVLAAAMAIFALFFEPDLQTVTANPQESNLLPKAKAEAIHKKQQEIKKILAKKKRNENESPKLKELDIKMDQLFSKDIDPKSKDDVRKMAEEIQKLEEEVKQEIEKAKAAARQKQQLQNQLDDLNKLTGDQENKNEEDNKNEGKDDKNKNGKNDPNNKGAGGNKNDTGKNTNSDDKNKNGKNKKDAKKEGKNDPAKKLMDAVNKGDSKKAEQELKKLQDKIANNKLDKQEKQKLEDRLDKMQQQAEQNAKKQEAEKKKLEQKKQEGQLSKQEQKKLEEANKKEQEMKELSKCLGECKNGMKEGNGKKASTKLGEAMGQLNKLADQKQDIQKKLDALAKQEQAGKQLQQNQKLLQEARQNIVQNLNQGNPQNGNGNNKGQNPGGLRPSQATEVKFKDELQKAHVDDKGSFKVIGHAYGAKKSKIPSKDLPSVYRETAQEAQQAIDRQPISPEAAELLKGYYQNLSGQKE